MECWKILALVVAAGYVVFAGLTLYGGGEQPSTEEVYDTFIALVGLLAISLGCIFYGEELGSGLIGAKMGMISSASPGWAVQLMGWVFLFSPIMVVLYWHFQGTDV